MSNKLNAAVDESVDFKKMRVTIRQFIAHSFVFYFESLTVQFENLVFMNCRERVRVYFLKGILVLMNTLHVFENFSVNARTCGSH